MKQYTNCPQMISSNDYSNCQKVSTGNWYNPDPSSVSAFSEGLLSSPQELEKTEDLSQKRESETVKNYMNNKKGMWDDEFNVEIKIAGFIRDIDFEKKEFVVSVDEKDGYEKDFSLPFSDIDDVSFAKIKIGTSILYTYGKRSDGGTISNSSQILVREDLTWNRRRLLKKQKEADYLYNLLSDDDFSS